MKLSEYAPQFFEVFRDGNFETLGILVSEPNISFVCFAESELFLKKACEQDMISCIICTPELAKKEYLIKSEKGIAVCSSPRTSFYSLHNWLAKNISNYTRETRKRVIGSNCKIHPTAIIEEGVSIGDNVLIEEYVVVRSGTQIGNNVILRAGCVIGGSNQIVSHYEDGTMFLVEQCGGVKLKNNIEVGYHALIACGMFPYEVTVVNSNSCVDTNVVIAHNCAIGENVMVLAQAQVCGSTKVDNNVRISPQAIVSNCLHIEKDSTITIGSVVVNNVKENKKVSGNFAIEHDKFLKWHMKKIKETRQ